MVIEAGLDNVTISTEPDAIPIARTPPVALGSLTDQSYSAGSGAQVLDASGVFSGDEVTYSVNGMGASVNASTGIVTIPTDADGSGGFVGNEKLSVELLGDGCGRS